MIRTREEGSGAREAIQEVVVDAEEEAEAVVVVVVVAAAREMATPYLLKDSNSSSHRRRPTLLVNGVHKRVLPLQHLHRLYQVSAFRCQAGRSKGQPAALLSLHHHHLDGQLRDSSSRVRSKGKPIPLSTQRCSQHC